LIITWQGKWERKFPIEKHYQIRIFVKNIKGEDEAILSFGSACPGVLPGGDYTVATSCTFAYDVDGVDNGNLTIAGPETCAPSGCQLTINAGQTVVWNPGKSVYVNGSIWINKPGGQLKKTYLWATTTDADNDGYASSGAAITFYAQDAKPAGAVRRYTLNSLTASDCNDSDNARWQNRTCYYDGDNDGYRTAASQTRCVGSDCTNSTDAYKRESTAPVDCDDSTSAKYQNLTCYVDGDGDTYGTGTASTQCCGSACGQGCTGYSATSTDCCDSDANAKPGQILYFTTAMASPCSGYDYNCSGTLDKDPKYNCLTSYGSTVCSGGLCPLGTHGGYGSTIPSCGSTSTFYKVKGYNTIDCSGTVLVTSYYCNDGFSNDVFSCIGVTATQAMPCH
jgi:hypothetical protein